MVVNDIYYHGARYYASWLGRWASPDPSGMVDGPNLYRYVRGSPIVLSDPNGMQSGSGTTVSKRSSLTAYGMVGAMRAAIDRWGETTKADPKLVARMKESIQAEGTHRIVANVESSEALSDAPLWFKTSLLTIASGKSVLTSGPISQDASRNYDIDPTAFDPSDVPVTSSGGDALDLGRSREYGETFRPEGHPGYGSKVGSEETAERGSDQGLIWVADRIVEPDATGAGTVSAELHEVEIGSTLFHELETHAFINLLVEAVEALPEGVLAEEQRGKAIEALNRTSAHSTPAEQEQGLRSGEDVRTWSDKEEQRLNREMAPPQGRSADERILQKKFPR